MLRLILQSTARTAAIISKQSIQRHLSHLTKVQNRLLTGTLNSSACSISENQVANLYIQTKAEFDDKKEKVPKTIQILSTNTPSLAYETFQSIQNCLVKPGAITIDNGFAILKSCSQLLDRTVSERALLVQTVWTRLTKLIDKPTTRDAIQLINAFCRTGKSLDNHQKFLERFRLNVDIAVYERLVYWSCRNDGDLKTVELILDEMKAKGLQPTESIFDSLILGNSKYGLSEVYGVLDKMKEANLHPSNGTYKELIIAHLRHGEHTKAIELFEDDSADNLNPPQLYAIIRAAAIQQCEPIIIAAINRLPEMALNEKALNDNIRNICVGLIHLNRERAPDAQLDPYDLIIRHFPVPIHGQEDSETYGNYLLREMIAIDQNVGDILKLCQQLQESNRNARSLHFCCIGALAHKKQIAVDFLRELSKSETLRPHYLWPLFLQTDHDYAELLKVLEFAGETKTPLDAHTLLKYVLPQMESINGESIITILSQYGVQMNELKSALIAYFLHRKRPLEARTVAKKSKAAIDPFIILPALVDFAKDKRYKIDVFSTIADIVSALQKSKTNAEHYDIAGQLLYTLTHNPDQVNTIRKLVDNYQKYGVKMSSNMVDLSLFKLKKKPEIFNEMDPILYGMKDFDNFTDIHEKQKTVERGTRIEQLEQHLAELEANNDPTQGALFKLFSLHVQKNDIDRARVIFQKCIEASVIPTAAFLSACCKFWILQKKADNALKCYDQLQAKYKSFPIDSYKIIDLMTLLIDEDRLSDANRVIQSSPGSNPSAMGAISRNIWDLMTATSNYSHRHQQTDNMAKQMLDNLVRWGFCRYTKPLLGVVIKEYLDKFDIIQATEYFIKSVNDQKVTPQFLSLLTTLVRISIDTNDEAKRYQISAAEGTEYIQRVVDAAITIYSTSQVNSNILMALACTGNEEHARIVLLDPVVEISANQLVTTIEYLAKRGELDGIGVLLRAARNTHHSALDRTVAYEALFKQYEIENDFKSAVELYKILSNDGYGGITKKFGKQLCALLTRNKQKIPQSLLVG